MISMLIAQYALVVAIIFTVLALGAQILVVTTRQQQTAAQTSRATVSVGDGPAEYVSNEAPGSAKERKYYFYAVAFTAVAFVLLTAYLVLRMIHTGHGPFANQHEFSVAFGWGILLALLFFMWRYKVRTIALFVLPVVALMLIYATQLDTEIRPLVPALKNNLLLTFHVGFAVVAYGAACVSFGAAVVYLALPYLPFKRLPRPEVLDEVGYRAAAFTFPLLTIMIILGSIWANVAWGRYWGWDPKETASFVTWLIYGAYLHARVTLKWKGTRSAVLLILGFVAVLFTYFGNHFFDSLHSYA
ncbi:c-type cytochrome biogenesis protein CcsB [Gleimia hominis]|uniref:C-type cytochrome biogenesis protein CcsB n=1 Tax=Gleimia hominis TaxID=595468 RepID=A0ABU3ICL4_9ACTO|nr:c-type cytochrome biogenesis protein CcsB [Gleimia hominis]MDT3768003.1 c-type cytochrome biogenesis protein CcsB [Gleimia hominis]